MIETKIPMDVRSYKAKLLGPFTTRQLVCITLAAIVDAILFFSVIKPLGMSLRPAIFILIFFDVPIIAFTFDAMGMTMEQYVKSVLIRSFLVPVKRKAKSSLPASRSATYTKKERKESQKRMKTALKTHPEFKAYQ